MFVWKTFEAKSKFLFLRHKNCMWKLKVVKANKIAFEYRPYEKNLTCREGILDKSISWPEHRLNIQSLLAEMKSNRKTPLEPYKFIMNSTEAYLNEMEVHLQSKFERSTGASLLHFAAEKDDPQYLLCLIDKFEKKNLIDIIDNEGYTPLHYSCKLGILENTRILLESGANANVAAYDGSTSLMLLARRKKHDTKLVKLLLKYNASCEATNKEGLRAIDIARNLNKNSPIVKLIHPMFSQM